MAHKLVEKIVMVIPTLELAGAERMMSQLSVGMKKRGIDITVICFFYTDSSISNYLKENGINIIYLNKKRGVDFRIVRKLFIILNDIKPDIVHTHLNTLVYVALPCLFYNIAMVHTVHNIAIKELPILSRNIHKLLYKTKRVVPVAISPVIKETISMYYDLPLNSIPVIYNGTDLSKCYLKKQQSVYVTKIIHIGRFDYQKNHKMLVQVFGDIVKKYSEIKLILCGTGELEEEIRQKVKEMNISDNVIFCGLVDDVFKLLHEADIFILPSLYEGFPITIIEAMGTGIPIIATDVGGVRDIIQDGINGLLCKVEKEDIKNKLEYCIRNYQLRVRLGKNAAANSKKYSLVNMTKEYVELYKRTILKKD